LRGLSATLSVRKDGFVVIGIEQDGKRVELKAAALGTQTPTDYTVVQTGSGASPIGISRR
jgi:hypothetical protein